MPCSFGVIGIVLRSRCEDLEAARRRISTPPGARLSSLTTPVTRTVDSWVTRSMSAQSSSETSLRPATACTVPPVARTWRKAILPLERLLSIHPAQLDLLADVAGQLANRSRRV